MSVEKAFQLLQAIAASGTPRSVPHLAATCGFSKPAAYRLLRALEKSGAVFRDPETGRCSLGLLITEMAARDTRYADLRARAAGPMRWLRDACGETVLLYVPLDAGEIACIEALPGLHEIRRHETLGRPIPLARGATSMVLLADRLATCGEAAVTAYLGGLPEDLRPPDIPGFLARLAAVRRQGWAHTVAERVPGAASIAAPVPSPVGGAAAVVVLSGPADRFTPVSLPRWTPLVLRAARDVAARAPEPDRSPVAREN